MGNSVDMEKEIVEMVTLKSDWGSQRESLNGTTWLRLKRNLPHEDLTRRQE